MKTILATAILAILAAPAFSQGYVAPGTTMKEKLTQERREGDIAERKTRERTYSNVPESATQPNHPVIIINNQLPAPAININNNNNNTNSVNTTNTLQSQQAIGAGAPAISPLRPSCSVGVVTNLGLDQFGRPIFANVRTGPGMQFGPVSGPDLTPVLLPDGVRVGVCGRQGRWLSVEIQTPVAPIQGWVFERYVGVL
jgi:hypothetical protein